MDGHDKPALEFDGLFKRFGDHVAVDHIDLKVPAGSFFGLAGPNGAGKTTALPMAVGLLRPDGGAVRIFGHVLPATPLGAVLGRELRLYSRSVLRSMLLMISFLVGVVVA